MAANSATVLTWIKTEVDQTLLVVRDNIARFQAAPEDIAALDTCPDHLHQVSGALRIVGLNGATRFCEAIEGTFSSVNGGKLSKPAIGVIDRAVFALKDFVDDLARGEANVPLRLYPVYRELTKLQGKSNTSEKDLFFPDLTLPAPAHSAPRSVRTGELAPFVQSQRVRFQRGLLAWLRHQPAGLQEMRKALDALHQIAQELPEPRALWWAGCGMLEGLLTEPDPDWVGTARALCNKLDFQMRDIAAAPRSAIPAGSRTASEALLRDLLYAVAKCKPATSRIKGIKRLYQLDSLIPEPDLPGVVEFDMDRLLPALDEVRSRLAALEGEWLLYVSGETESVARFRELVASFKDNAHELGSPQLARLLDVMITVSARLPDGYPRDRNFMVIEMASAFLLVESIVENFADPPDDLPQQVGIMGDWLLDAATGKSSGNAPAGLRTDLTQQIGALQLRAQVAKEILTNLQHVEQVLDAFARDRSMRHTLPGLKPYLRQIHGALVVLNFDLAMEVTSVCDFMIGECAKADHDRVDQDMDTIAEGLSSLVYFLEPCLHGREPADQAIALFFERFNARRAPAADAPAAPAAATGGIAADIALFAAVPAAEPVPGARPATAALAADMATARGPAETQPVAPAPPTSPELVAIFLDEADEVLAAVADAIPICREKPHDREALAIIMRGFHTLKGSGRMVQLNDLGEIAWEIEQVVNRYLEENRPATPELLELITTGSATFSEGVERLRAGEPLTLDARHIVDLAHRLKILEDPAAGPAERVAAEPSTPAAPSPPAAAETPPPLPRGREMRTMFDDLDEHLLPIFLEGAQELLPLIGGDLREWKSSPGRLNHPQSLRRALRTLKGSARMAGAIRLGELAHIMESRVEAAIEAGEFPPALFEDLESKMDRLTFDVERMGLDLERTRNIQGERLASGAAPQIEIAREAPLRGEPPLPGPASALRTNAEVLEGLISQSGEVSIARSRIEAELRLARQTFSDLNDSIARLRTQLREVESLLSRLE